MTSRLVFISTICFLLLKTWPINIFYLICLASRGKESTAPKPKDAAGAPLDYSDIPHTQIRKVPPALPISLTLHSMIIKFIGIFWKAFSVMWWYFTLCSAFFYILSLFVTLFCNNIYRLAYVLETQKYCNRFLVFIICFISSFSIFKLEPYLLD